MFSRRHGPSRLGAAAVTGAAAARLQGRIGVVVRIRMIPRDRETVVSSFSCSRLKGGRGHIELCSLFTVHRSIRGRVSSVYVCIWWYVVRGAWCVVRGAWRISWRISSRQTPNRLLPVWILFSSSDTHGRLVRTAGRRTDGRTDGRTDIGRSVCQYRVVVSGRHAFEFEQQVSGVVEGGAAGGRVGGPA